MAARLDFLLDLAVDTFLTGADGRLNWDPAELQRGMEDALEQEEKEEVLCFLLSNIILFSLRDLHCYIIQS